MKDKIIGECLFCGKIIYVLIGDNYFYSATPQKIGSKKKPSQEFIVENNRQFCNKTCKDEYVELYD